MRIVRYERIAVRFTRRSAVRLRIDAVSLRSCGAATVAVSLALRAGREIILHPPDGNGGGRQLSNSVELAHRGILSLLHAAIGAMEQPGMCKAQVHGLETAHSMLTPASTPSPEHTEHSRLCVMQ